MTPLTRATLTVSVLEWFRSQRIALDDVDVTVSTARLFVRKQVQAQIAAATGRKGSDSESVSGEPSAVWGDRLAAKVQQELQKDSPDGSTIPALVDEPDTDLAAALEGAATATERTLLDERPANVPGVAEPAAMVPTNFAATGPDTAAAPVRSSNAQSRRSSASATAMPTHRPLSHSVSSSSYAQPRSAVVDAKNRVNEELGPDALEEGRKEESTDKQEKKEQQAGSKWQRELCVFALACVCVCVRVCVCVCVYVCEFC
jgi:hypothetical protein